MSNVTILNDLSKMLGKKGWVDGDDSLAWHRDWLNRYGVPPLGVARPSSINEISKIISLCNDHAVHIVMQGGNTGLVGGSVLGSKNGIILSLDRMNKILSLDEASGIISLEAGVILGELHNFLDKTNLMFPMHLGSEGSAQVGGLIATNSGGSHAFRYGMMQDLVIGLEVLLADGKIWNGMRSVQKDNAGYQLRKLFCGSEGTLGIITKANLKLFPKPKQEFTALLAVKNSLGLVELSKKLREEAGEFLTAMEFFSDTGLDIALENIPDLIFPLNSRSSFYLLIEVGSGSKHVPLNSIILEIIEWGMNKDIVIDGALASSEKQRSNFWRLREDQPEGQRRLGKQLKHDISVPPGSIVEFLDNAYEICNYLIPGIRVNSFGHLGDGNIHYNLSPPLGENDFLDLDSKIYLKLGELATSMSGSFAAEHGIGRAKVMMADKLRDSTERNLMRELKQSLDQYNKLNPGVLLSDK